MHDTTALARTPVAAKAYTPADNPHFVALHRRFPTVAYLRTHARRHLPRFAFEYADGGAGADGGINRNWDALDAVELMAQSIDLFMDRLCINPKPYPSFGGGPRGERAGPRPGGGGPGGPGGAQGGPGGRN